MSLALSMREAGYTVFVNTDASGALDVRAAESANARMRDAGVIVLPKFAVFADLLRDWRNATDAILKFAYEYVFPAWIQLYRRRSR